MTRSVLLWPVKIGGAAPGGSLIVEKHSARLKDALFRGADVNERHPANPATSPLALARAGNSPQAVDALVKAGARD